MKRCIGSAHHEIARGLAFCSDCKSAFHAPSGQLPPHYDDGVEVPTVEQAEKLIGSLPNRTLYERVEREIQRQIERDDMTDTNGEIWRSACEYAIGTDGADVVAAYRVLYEADVAAEAMQR